MNCFYQGRYIYKFICIYTPKRLWRLVTQVSIKLQSSKSKASIVLRKAGNWSLNSVSILLEPKQLSACVSGSKIPQGSNPTGLAGRAGGVLDLPEDGREWE